VFSNGDRGIRVRDSESVIVFNNLVYGNGDTGIDLGGENQDRTGGSKGAVINNTVYANGRDGIRIEGVVPARDVTVLHNVITRNGRIVIATETFGINLKEPSQRGFRGQWNLNTDGYNTLRVARGSLDLERFSAVFVFPDEPLAGTTGPDGDDFRLVLLSDAESAGAVPPDKLGLHKASTQIDGRQDDATVDLGFHFGNKTDFVDGFRKSPEQRLRALRKLAKRCEKLAFRAREKFLDNRGPCLKKRAKARLLRRCGPIIEKEICD
jgi:parallel beta-helix repeat protein